MGEKPHPKIEVELLDSVKVKQYNDVTVKDFYSSILKSQDLFTTSATEYSKALLAKGTDKEKSNTKGPTVPKFLIEADSNGIPSCTLIGNAMIATPSTPNFGAFPARLESYGVTYQSSSPKWADACVTNSNKSNGFTAFPRQGNQLKGKDISTPSLFTSSEGAVFKDSITGKDLKFEIDNDFLGDEQKSSVKGSTASTNAWAPTQDLRRNMVSQYEEVMYESGFGIRKYDLINPESTINSMFSLQKYQPFSLRFKLGKLSEVQRSALISAEGDSITPNKIRLIEQLPSSVDIDFGDFRLTYYDNGKIRLIYKGEELHSANTSLVSEKDKYGGAQLTIYPLGEYIYIYNGVPSTDATKKGNYVAYNLHTTKYNTGGRITLRFKSGESFFNFSPVIHINSGVIKSPYFSAGYTPDQQIFVVGYLGKFGVGARTSPITFPDGGDKEKSFSYLSKNKIEYEIDSVADTSFSYTLTLKVDNFAAVSSSFQNAAHAAITETFANIATEISNVRSAIATGDINQVNAANGQAQYNLGIPTTNIGITTDSDGNVIHVNPGQTAPAGSTFHPLPFDPTDGPRYSIADTWRDTMNTFKFGQDLGSSATTYINGASNDMQSLVASMFGFGGDIGDASNWVNANGGSLNDGMSRAKKQAKNTASEQYIRELNANIFSPAAYYTQFTLKKELTDVNLNPSPQIDNCDLLEVTVNQAVEQSSASITLDNRVACQTGNKKGKYTYIKGQNNFTGVKPIQIKMGYESAGSADSGFGLVQTEQQHVVFTGYVCKYDYDRPSPSQSTCTLSCEDATKKAKEQFVVNLPFFDGWCVLGAFYYLAKEAGFSDDEILLEQDPVSGRSTRIRDLLTGDPDTFTGGCFDGHANDTPTGGAGLSGPSLHRTLPLAMVGANEPNYNFSFGTSYWDCMNKIREFCQYYLYANNHGNLIFGPKTSVIKETDFEFVEVDKASNFNEIQRRLDVSYDTSQCRNAVFLQGLTFNKDLDTGAGITGNWTPHVHIRRKPNFPNDIGDISFSPWLRYLFWRDCKFEYPALAALNASELLRRATRERAVADFGGWGNPALFPYHIISIKEDSNETGINAFSKVIIAAHTLRVSASNFQIQSDFSTETLDVGTLNYDNNIPLRE